MWQLADNDHDDDEVGDLFQNLFTTSQHHSAPGRTQSTCCHADKLSKSAIHKAICNTLGASSVTHWERASLAILAGGGTRATQIPAIILRASGASKLYCTRVNRKPLQQALSLMQRAPHLSCGGAVCRVLYKCDSPLSPSVLRRLGCPASVPPPLTVLNVKKVRQPFWHPVSIVPLWRPTSRHRRNLGIRRSLPGAGIGVVDDDVKMVPVRWQTGHRC